MMRRCEFRRGRTEHDLVKRWHASLDYVRRVTAEASRLVAREVTDREAVSADVGTVIRSIVQDDAQETRERVRAADVWARLAGAYAAERVEVSEAPPVTASPEWRALHGILARALEPYPEAAAAVVRELEAYAREQGR